MKSHAVTAAPSAPAAPTALTDHDVYLFREGSHSRLYQRMGGRLTTAPEPEGARFALWAPNARAVSVIGDFNGWNPESHPLRARGDHSGIWEGFVEGARAGQTYKFRIFSNHNGYVVDKADPFGVHTETPPHTGSRLWALDYQWNDSDWMSKRREKNSLNAPMSTYEVHLGSWRRGENARHLTYREMATQLAAYVVEMGFTHVELMPVMEHPFYGSWGYQCTGFFAPSSRFGTPQDFMYLVDTLHQAGIGVILDWVPSHFPSDEHGLAYFDGTHLFEHADPRQGFHPEWNSAIFNYGRDEVRSFLLSSALFWLDMYHADGLRVDAVASMLYLDYGRKEGEWIPNRYGGKENLDAIEFLRKLNESAYGDHPDVQIIAEESTAWPMVSRPNYAGGLGFGMKWNMGWMHDTLRYFGQDPVHRKYNHAELTFGVWYAFTENFVLPLSHDEVVHGKRSLLTRMPGDEWQRFANLRALFGYMWSHPGKKLLFMGGEFGQWTEWNHDDALQWSALEYPMHEGVRRWLADVNHVYRSEKALHECDFSDKGFEWIDCHDWEQSVLSFIRRGNKREDQILVVCNLTPVPRYNYRVGVPDVGYWRELLNSDASVYCGSGMGNGGGVESAPVSANGRYHSLAMTLPPLSVLYFKLDV